jgi:hypothetical protein
MPEIALPKELVDQLPEELREYALYLFGGIVCIGLFLVLLMLLAIAKFLFGGKSKKGAAPKLVENLEEYPELKPSTGDRQLRVEGVPVRIRLVVVAPAGTLSEVDPDEVGAMLSKILPGLEEIYAKDKPRVKVWPKQVSYQGFANHFHRCMITGAKPGEQTRWVLVAGRAKLGKYQIMLGLALQSVKPNTVGRRTVDSHEWASILRVRVRE